MRDYLAEPLTQDQQRQVERLARRYAFETSELLSMIAECAQEGFDPAATDGEPFAFARSNVIGPDYFQSANVPPADANVSVAYAMNVAQHDAMTGRYLLDEYPMLTVVVSVHTNAVLWFRFFAVRDPKPDRRAWFKASADAREAELKRLLDRVDARRTSGRPDVPGTLLGSLYHNDEARRLAEIAERRQSIRIIKKAEGE